MISYKLDYFLTSKHFLVVQYLKIVSRIYLEMFSSFKVIQVIDNFTLSLKYTISFLLTVFSFQSRTDRVFSKN